MQTNATTTKPRNSSWWDSMSHEQQRAHIAKMTAGRRRARKAANGNGRTTRNALADAFDDAALEKSVALVDEAAAEWRKLNDAKRALSGDNGFLASFDITHAVRVVQDALERGELELVAHDGKPAFYRVTRERID